MSSEEKRMPDDADAEKIRAQSAWDYAAMKIGANFGSTLLIVDEEFLTEWSTIYGPHERVGLVPMGVIPLLLMRAFISIVTPRHPGNLHVGQCCEIHRLPRINSILKASVTCADKQLTRNRRIVKLKTQIWEGQETAPAVLGLMTVFWGK